MIGQPSRHRRRRLHALTGFAAVLCQCTVRRDEVVGREEQRQRRLVILPLLREGVRQSRHPSVLHSDRQVVALNVGRASLLQVWLAATNKDLRGENFARRISVIVFKLAVLLDDNSMIDGPAFAFKDQRNDFFVRCPSIGRNLEPAARVVLNLIDEDGRIDAVALAQVPCQNQLRLPLDSRVAIGVANLFRLDSLLDAHLLLHLNPAPNFVTLDVLRRHVFQPDAKELFTLVADTDE